MATLTLRSEKGLPLTIAEVDTNFSNLNSSKVETTDAVSTNTADKVVRRDASGNFAANVITAVDFNSTSDARLKENVTPLGNALETISSIDGVSFNWKSTGDLAYGVIAQDIERILPAIVDEDADGIKSVAYSQIIAFLVEAVKELKQEVDDLKGRL